MAALLILAAVAVGLAIQLHDGEYTPMALGLVTLALIAAIAAFSSLSLWERVGVKVGCGESAASSPHPHPLPVGEGGRGVSNDGILTLLLTVGVVLQLALLMAAWPGVDLPHRGGWQLMPFYLGLGAALFLFAIGVLAVSKPAGTAWFPLLLLIHLTLSIWMVRSSPAPQIDVWVFQQNGAEELLKGRNPYAMTFPDIYHSTLPGHQRVYGEGLVVNDRLQFGFPYPPVSLLFAAVGYAIAGDFRYAQAAALVLAGLFIGYCRTGYMPKLAAALFLFTPRVFYVLGRGWTEPFGVMLLAMTVFFACRRPRWLPLALGLLLATKQYLLLALPLTCFFVPQVPRLDWKAWLKLLGKTALVAAIVTLPLALWNPHAFWESAVAVQERAPFRWDALSYLVFYGKARANFHALDFPIWLVSRKLTVTDSMTAVIWSTSAAVVILMYSLWRSPRTPAGFAASLALVSLAFFAFNKQAFCNYYFFVIGALCCAIAATTPPAERFSTSCATPSLNSTRSPKHSAAS